MFIITNVSDATMNQIACHKYWGLPRILHRDWPMNVSPEQFVMGDYLTYYTGYILLQTFNNLLLTDLYIIALLSLECLIERFWLIRYLFKNTTN